MSDTQTIKDRLDIVQVIGEYVTLKKAGANWKAPCPFHNEKSPSFMVHADKQIWHCFGCSKGGDVFTFVQEIEGLEFPEVLKLLAKRAGVEITTYKNDQNAGVRQRLIDVNTAAAYFFHHMLLEMPVSESARDYLQRRGLKPETIRDWQVGFIPDQWELLTKYLLKKGHGIDDLIASGLTIKRDGADAKTGRGYYDRFRGRVMFPIADAHGNVVGFTGRVLVETEHSGGKYVNTPETPLYEKSRVLYGLHKAKTSIKSKDLAVIVEGQMDVVACHQAGMTNVVAASGTALTLEQIKLLKRYTNNLAMAFDADQAGQNAGKRGIGLAIEAGMNVRVIQIPLGFAKDADECLKKDPAVWFAAVEKAKSVMDWYFAITLEGLKRNDPKEKQRAANILVTEINRIPQAVERDEWLKRLADELSIEISILRSESRKVASAEPRNPRQPNTEPAHPVQIPAITIPKTQLDIFGLDFWSLLVKYPDHYIKLRDRLKPAYFSDAWLARLYETAEKLYTKESLLTSDALRVALAPEAGENPVDILLLRPYKNLAEVSPVEAGIELQSVLDRMEKEWRKDRSKQLTAAIATAEKAGDKETLNRLMQEIQTLQ